MESNSGKLIGILNGDGKAWNMHCVYAGGGGTDIEGNKFKGEVEGTQNALESKAVTYYTAMSCTQSPFKSRAIK